MKDLGQLIFWGVMYIISTLNIKDFTIESSFDAFLAVVAIIFHIASLGLFIYFFLKVMKSGPSIILKEKTTIVIKRKKS